MHERFLPHRLLHSVIDQPQDELGGGGSIAKSRNGRVRRVIRRIEVPAVALTSRWLTSRPRFQVLAAGPLEIHPSDQRWAPGLRLHPTPQFWLWFASGSLICAIGLSSSRAMSVAAMTLSIIWLCLLLARVRRLRNKERRLSAGLPVDLPYNPFAGQSRACLAWVPAPFALLAIESITLARSFSERHDGSAEAELPAIAFLAVCIVAAVIYRVWLSISPSALALPSLDRWYLSRPLPARALIARVAHRPPLHPSSTWRRIPDLSFELNSAGTAIALFGEDASRPIWRRSVLYVLWYFAPVLVPLLALFVTPVLIDTFAPSGLSNAAKLKLGLAAMLWLAWSLSFFEGAGNQDFLRGQHARDRRLPGSLADLLRYPDGEMRRVARDYFRGRGAIVFSLLALSVMPVYFDYLGLFSPTDGGTQAKSGLASISSSQPNAPADVASAPMTKPPPDPASAPKKADSADRSLLICGRNGRCEQVVVPVR